jgi:hypothetical protein
MGWATFLADFLKNSSGHPGLAASLIPLRFRLCSTVFFLLCFSSRVLSFFLSFSVQFFGTVHLCCLQTNKNFRVLSERD